MSLLVTGEPMGQADPILGLMCGFLLLIVSGCALAALAIAGDRGIVNINRIEWIALTVIAFVCYGLWEHIEKALELAQLAKNLRALSQMSRRRAAA
jgi:hypothetical protein